MNLPVKAVCLFILTCVSWQSATAADSDLQLWSLMFGNFDFENDWSASMQLETRFSDNDSDLYETIIKPGGYYRFTPRTQVGVGYKYQIKNDESDEQDLWQEVYYKTPIGRFDLQHQVRLEERFIDDISGIIPRIRYLIHASYPLTGGRYLVASEAVRFNLDNKGEGPVSGFEQNRLYFGMGFHTSKKLKIEVGYLWRYERQREGENDTDHVLRLQIMFATRPPHPAHAGS